METNKDTEREEYCTWLPVPDHTRTDRGFTHLNEWDVYERSHAEEPMLEVGGQTVGVADAERYALAILWMVRHHYQGYGPQLERQHDDD